MEQRAANGEDGYVSKNNRPAVKRFTPPRKLGEESGSEYSDSDYSDSEYSESEDYSSDSYSDEEGQDKEYLRNVREAARAKALRAKIEATLILLMRTDIRLKQLQNSKIDLNNLPLKNQLLKFLEIHESIK